MNITRTVYYAKFSAGEFDYQNGQALVNHLDDFTITSTRPVTKEAMMKIAKQKLKRRDTLVIFNEETWDEVRSITFEDFMEFSVPIVRPNSQRKDN